MLKLKKIMSVLITAVICISIAVCGSTAVLADDYGTFEDGIPANGKNMANYMPFKDGKGMRNGDFEQGLMYWGTQRGNALPSSRVTLMEEDGNHFIEFAAENNWDGIYSTTFSDSRVSAEESISALFKYRGDTQFQIVLMQICMSADGKSYSEQRIGLEFKTLEIESGTDGWSIAVIDPKKTVVEPSSVDPKYDDPTIYFTFFVQVMQDPTCTAQIDDIQLVKYNKSSGMVYDLDGKQLYDMKNLPINQISITDDDYEDYIQDTYNYTVEKETEGKKDAAEGEGFVSKYLWVIIAGGAVIVIAAAVIIIIAVKKKKTPVSSDENTTEEGQTQEAAEENIDTDN